MKLSVASTPRNQTEGGKGLFCLNKSICKQNFKRGGKHWIMFSSLAEGKQQLLQPAEILITIDFKVRSPNNCNLYKKCFSQLELSSELSESSVRAAAPGKVGRFVISRVISSAVFPAHSSC